MLSDKIIDLENKIKNLNEIQGFKKSIAEYNKIKKELDKYMDEIMELEKNIEISCEIEEITDPISDEKYFEYISEIKSLSEIFENLEINEQIQIYQNIKNKIKQCDDYLKSQKMEVIYIDK